MSRAYTLAGIPIDRGRWARPLLPWPADVERWTRFCAEIEARISMVRRTSPANDLEALSRLIPRDLSELTMPPATEARACAHTGCSETFLTRPSANKKYHSYQCAMAARYAAQFGPRPSREARTRTCLACEAPFVVVRLTDAQRFCGVGCGQRRRVEIPAPS